jgi:CDP-6-deoxy-D-xylo-4-hexulose-3-dehydrase
VNIAGNTVDIAQLREFKKKNIITVLDNCDGYGTTYKNKPIESYFDVSATSFHAAHIITTGEGGAFFTDNKTYYNRAKSIREWGRADDSDVDDIAKKEGMPEDYPGRYTYITKGFNLKPIELQAAMGRVQLKKLQKIKAARLANYTMLSEGVKKRKLPFIISTAPKDTSISWFAFSFTLKTPGIRSKLRKFLEEKNIETRVIFAGNIIRQPAYKYDKNKVSGSLKNSDIVMQDSFFISVHPSVTKPMIQYILESFDEFFSTANSSNKKKG